MLQQIQFLQNLLQMSCPAEFIKPLLRLVDPLSHPLKSPARLRGNPVVEGDIEVIFSDVTSDGLSGGVSQTEEVEPPDSRQLFCLVY